MIRLLLALAVLFGVTLIIGYGAQAIFDPDCALVQTCFEEALR